MNLEEMKDEELVKLISAAKVVLDKRFDARHKEEDRLRQMMISAVGIAPKKRGRKAGNVGGN